MGGREQGNPPDRMTWRVRVVSEADPVPLRTGTHILAVEIIEQARRATGSRRRTMLTAGWAQRHDGSVSDPNLEPDG